ncbi:MAG: choice-of-anchor E domain-containing protein [Rhizonema sp. NSF051]|nr:choice-of-anchor E domain-containing protein [Rhizonema sp. NSF051]
MNTKLLSIITAGTTFFSIVAMTGSANAASLSSTASVGYALTDIVDTPLSIQQFNSNLGQLQSVTLDFTSAFLGDVSYQNKGSRPTTVNVDFGGEADLTLNNQSLFTLNPSQHYSYAAPAKASSLTKVDGLTTKASQTATYTNANFLQFFIGTGSLDFLFSAYANPNVSGLGNGTVSIDTNADANVQVTYKYKPQTVPEPRATLGIGLIAALGLLSQRKKSFSKCSVLN